MSVVETIARIRRDHPGKSASIEKVAQDLKVARDTIRKTMRSDETSAVYAQGSAEAEAGAVDRGAGAAPGDHREEAAPGPPIDDAVLREFGGAGL
ncbi:MAG: hypothetical protein OXF89_04105 [Rhodospirillaceae bacterium]|nr:hypothetical protein [Rhodospirillaceae bacterium]